MNLISRRRLSRLEKRAASVVAERKRREPEEMAEEMAWLHQAALDHATKLVTVILHGEPRLDEPLAIAWERALSHLGLGGTRQILIPSHLFAVLAALPGDTENAIARVFSSAPSWLLHFCMASLDCFVLGIELSKSSEPAPECGRDGLRDMRSWPDLPKGTIGAGPPIPKLNVTLCAEERADLTRLLRSGEENWSRRDRHRHSEIMAKLDRTDTASN